jgi:arabinan endo-1,5-alpha-L-arabinosidase
MTNKLLNFGAFCLIASATSIADAKISNPVYPKDFPDPTTWQAPDGTWRAVSTSHKLLKSKDFFTWEDTGTRAIPHEELAPFRKRFDNVWAPDVFKNGKEYLMYISLIQTAPDSAIAVFSSKSPDGPFTNGKIITDSKITKIRDTIDPEVVRDEKGQLWLFFGSTGKIHRIKLAPDGKSIAKGAKYEHVAGLANSPGRKKVFEGPYLHKHDGWWYLFASRGQYWDHSYGVIVGRSKTLDGTFVDRKGTPMTEGGGTPVITSGPKDKFFGPGHNGEIVTINGRDYMALHCHIKGKHSGRRPLFVTEIKWDDEGWPKGSLKTK